MDSLWTGMIVFYGLLFTIALLLFTCLCILCKRKQRKTRDVNQQQQAGATQGNSASHRNTRSRPSLASLCGDVESTSSVESGEEAPNNTPDARLPRGRSNVAFESDNVSLPPGYDEALKSKYAKVYSIYPSLGSLRRASAPASLLPTSLSPSTSAGCSPSTSIESVESRLETVESPPPPYELAVRFIDSRGHF